MFLSFLLCIQRQQTGKGKQNWKSGTKTCFWNAPTQSREISLTAVSFFFQQTRSRLEKTQSFFSLFFPLLKGLQPKLLFFMNFFCSLALEYPHFFIGIGKQNWYIFSGSKFVKTFHDWTKWSQFVIVLSFSLVALMHFQPTSLVEGFMRDETRVFFLGGRRRGEDTPPHTHTHPHTHKQNKKAGVFPLQNSRWRKQMHLKKKIKSAQLVQKISQFKRTLRAYFPLGFSLPTISNAFFADHGWEPACIFWPDLNGTFSAWPNWSCAASACENHGMRA